MAPRSRQLKEFIKIASNPLVVMLVTSGGGGKCAVIRAFAPFLINEKSLTVMLNLFQHLTGLEVRCKSLHFDLGIADTSLEVRCKNA